MKKIIFIVLSFLIFTLNTYASYAIMNIDNGEIISGSSIHEKRLIASISKVMTAHIVIDCNIDLYKKVIVGDEINEAYGSSIYLKKGEEIRIIDLLYGLLLRSGNDAAVVLAKNVAGSTDKFVNLMNDYARKYHMDDTNFMNPSGLDDNGTENISSAYDMAILTSKAYKNSIFRKIFGAKKYSFKTNMNSYSFTNKNKALFMKNYVNGGKTGFTKKARRTLITTASLNNLNFVIVTLNVDDDFNFHISNYEKLFKSYNKYLILNKTYLNIKDDFYLKNKNYHLFLNDNYYYYGKLSDLKNLRVEYTIYKIYKVNNNDVVGKIDIYSSKKKIYSTPIYLRINKVLK